MEFYPLTHLRADAQPMFRELLAVSRATQIEAQTNIPWMLLMLYNCAKNITSESILFQDAFSTHLSCPVGLFRQATPEDEIFTHYREPVSDWVVEAGSTVVVTGTLTITIIPLWRHLHGGLRTRPVAGPR